MGLKERLDAARRRTRDISSEIRVRRGGRGGMSPLGAAFDRIMPGHDISSHDEQLKHFRGYPYAIIRTLAYRIARQPLNVARVVEDETAKGMPFRRIAREKHVPRSLWTREAKLEILPTHPLLRLIRSPNPLMTQWIFIFNTVVHMETTGKAFWWMSRNADGERELWTMPPQWMTPIHDDHQLFARWSIAPDGVPRFEVPASDVAYFYYPNPADPFGSLSPMEAMGVSVYADEAIEESQRRSFLNGCNPGLALTIGRLPEVIGVGNDQRPVLTTEQRQQIISSVKRYYRGLHNNEEPLILDGLITDAKTITNTPKEMAYLASSETTRARLNVGWGTNRISMGETGTNRAEAAVADDHFCDNAINPRIEMLSQGITQLVLPMFSTGADQTRYVAYIEEAHATDLDYQLAVETVGLDRGCITRNEFRAAHDMEPIEGGDSFFVPATSGDPGGNVLAPWQMDPEGENHLGAEERAIKRDAVEMQMVRSGLMTRNEFRQKRGLGPITGGDEMLLPSELLPVGWTEPDFIPALRDRDAN